MAVYGPDFNAEVKEAARRTQKFGIGGETAQAKIA
jgi:hypothetical protein